MRTLAAYLRGLDPHLPRMVWLVQAGGVVNSLGNGIVFPFAVIYLHNVRGISFADAGLALAIGGEMPRDRKSTRLNSSHVEISYAVFCLKKKKIIHVSCGACVETAV